MMIFIYYDDIHVTRIIQIVLKLENNYEFRVISTCFCRRLNYPTLDYSDIELMIILAQQADVNVF